MNEKKKKKVQDIKYTSEKSIVYSDNLTLT